MIEKLLLKIRARDELSALEEAALRRLPGPPLKIPADKTIIRAGEELTSSTLLLDGFMCRYKDLRNGTRQVSELQVPGDFVDLHSFTLKRLDHSIMTLTPCLITTVAHNDLREITETFPHLTRILWFATNLDAAIHREWMLSLGRRTAVARIAHLICELRVRLSLVGLADCSTFCLPLTQTDMAECMGLTAIHVNRTLRTLRERGLVTIHRGTVHISNLAELERVGEFSTDYLFLQRPGPAE